MPTNTWERFFTLIPYFSDSSGWHWLCRHVERRFVEPVYFPNISFEKIDRKGYWIYRG